MKRVKNVGKERWIGVSQQILTSLRGGENGQGWLGNQIPQRFIMSWQGRFYEGSEVPLLSGSVEIAACGDQL